MASRRIVPVLSWAFRVTWVVLSIMVAVLVVTELILHLWA
jgi:hypothetical protein